PPAPVRRRGGTGGRGAVGPRLLVSPAANRAPGGAGEVPDASGAAPVGRGAPVGGPGAAVPAAGSPAGPGAGPGRRFDGVAGAAAAAVAADRPPLGRRGGARDGRGTGRTS